MISFECMFVCFVTFFYLRKNKYKISLALYMLSEYNNQLQNFTNKTTLNGAIPVDITILLKLLQHTI